ncbi:MAG: DSD1 family PLP-dependent enzyme [Planctomycetales bacterium]
MSHMLVGLEKKSLDTPILCIDLPVMESNIRKMAEFCQEHGVFWRPHAKCHKIPAIAQRQLQEGAIGVTCAKVSEAEVLAAGGVRDILIANMVVGAHKIERLVALAHQCDPIVACDHYAQVEPLAALCRERGVTVRVIIEVDIGLNRVGVPPGKPVVDLAQGISQLKGVQFAGIMGYEGHLLTIANQEEKRNKIFESIAILNHATDLLDRAGIACDIVSAGGTGSFQIAAECPGVTELQAGGGIFMDPFYKETCQVKDLDYALTVLATVVSRPLIDKAVLDCGRKSLGFNPEIHLPLVKGYEDAKVQRMSAEHCEITLGPKSRDLKIGDKVEMIVGYGDLTTTLHDRFYGFRDDRLEVIWPMVPQGKLQ